MCLVILVLGVLLTSASGAPAKRSTGCKVQDPFGQAPQPSSDPLDASLLARYGVLRRAATAADQPPPVNSLADQVIGLGRYNPAFIRQLALLPGGRRFFVVPGFAVHIEIPPARCLPRELRKRRPKLVAQQLEREQQPIACIATTSPRTRAGSSFQVTDGGEAIGVGVGGYTAYAPLGCPSFGDVTRYEQLTTSGLEGLEHTGILPDEITSLRVRFRHAATVAVPVIENFYRYKSDAAARKKFLRQLRRLTRRLESRAARGRAQQRKVTRELFALTIHAASQLTPTSVQLLAADGRVINTVRRPKIAGAGPPSELTVPAPSASPSGG